jgi:hypothetical protein
MNPMDGRPPPSDAEAAVARYKTVLQKIIDNRPSGTRQRLAGALGKNRSFVSQIANPAYATPIPARHLETIFEICHFSPDDRMNFLEAYARAHPRRLASAAHARRLRPHTVYLPDLGDDARNHELDRMLADFVHRMTRLMEKE